MQVFALRREKVLAEQNENAVRQELSRVREQVSGYATWLKFVSALQKIAQLQWGTTGSVAAAGQLPCLLTLNRCCCIPQLDGMSLEHYRAWQRDHDALKRRIVELELELQAALDKLEVYRRTQPTSTSDILLGDERGEQGRG